LYSKFIKQEGRGRKKFSSLFVSTPLNDQCSLRLRRELSRTLVEGKKYPGGVKYRIPLVKLAKPGGMTISRYIEPCKGETIYSETENNLFKLHRVKK